MVYGTWYTNIRLPQTMVSGISLFLGLRNRNLDPYVCVCWVPSSMGPDLGPLFKDYIPYMGCWAQSRAHTLSLRAKAEEAKLGRGFS